MTIRAEVEDHVVWEPVVKCKATSPYVWVLAYRTKNGGPHFVVFSRHEDAKKYEEAVVKNGNTIEVFTLATDFCCRLVDGKVSSPF